MFDLTALIKQELTNGIFYSQFSESSVSGGEDGLELYSGF